MLAKTSRLNLKKDFKWVVAGKPLDTKYVKLFLRVGENTTPKVGIANSSKTFKKAVDRNRARRLVSAALESLYSELSPTINIVALPKTPILGVKSGDVLLELQEKLKDAKIIH
jgi:ribonuclease P protein component